jgi:hypothetical protein
VEPDAVVVVVPGVATATIWDMEPGRGTRRRALGGGRTSPPLTTPKNRGPSASVRPPSDRDGWRRRALPAEVSAPAESHADGVGAGAEPLRKMLWLRRRRPRSALHIESLRTRSIAASASSHATVPFTLNTAACESPTARKGLEGHGARLLHDRRRSGGVRHHRHGSHPPLRVRRSRGQALLLPSSARSRGGTHM